LKLPVDRAGLPGKVISFYIVPLDPAHKAGLTGHGPVKRLRCDLGFISPSQEDFQRSSEGLSSEVAKPSSSSPGTHGGGDTDPSIRTRLAIFGLR